MLVVQITEKIQFRGRPQQMENPAVGTSRAEPQSKRILLPGTNTCGTSDPLSSGVWAVTVIGLIKLFVSSLLPFSLRDQTLGGSPAFVLFCPAGTPHRGGTNPGNLVSREISGICLPRGRAKELHLTQPLRPRSRFLWTSRPVLHHL